MVAESLHPIRVYADTSVYGGVFDEEFAKPSRAFFDLVQLRICGDSDPLVGGGNYQ